MFAQNIYLLIGILLALVLGLVLLIASWTGFNIWIFRRKQSDANSEERRKKFDRDGRPLPPRAAGICDRCSQAGEVFHLPDGGRLCSDCFAHKAAAEP